MIEDLLNLLATANPAEALPAEGKARVMLAVLAAIVLALLGLIGITVLRIAHRRAAARDEATAPERGPVESPWSVAGKRAEPIDDEGDLRDG